MNSKQIIQSLQNFCNNTGTKLSFAPGCRIMVGDSPMSAEALTNHIGVGAANDNTPSAGVPPPAADLGAPGYETLADVLRRAFEQAAAGKGKERHANSLPFHLQPMQTIAKRRGVGFLLGQADKKSEEATSLPPGRDVAEILGAINYLAGAVIFLESQRHAANDPAASK